MSNEITSWKELNIELAKTPEDANLLRAKIDAARKILPQVVKDRNLRWDYAFDGNWAYVEASIKAGELWNAVEDKASAGRQWDNSKLISNKISSADAGFKNSVDATMCSRLATYDGVWTEQEIDDYKNNCDDYHKLPSLGGLYAYWKQVTGAEDDSRPWLRFYQVWNFMKADTRFGLEHPGMIPAQIMMNLSYYYTNTGDLVVDLFGGGGSTLDVCKSDNPDFGARRCSIYDIAPVRQDIEQWDVVANGLPAVDNIKMMFLDPPYWKQKRGEYSGDETNLANMKLGVFHNALEKIVRESIDAAEIVALIIGPTQENWNITDHAAEMICRIGVPWKRIQVPYSTQQHGGDYVRRAKENKQWLYLARDLMIWKKET